MPELTIAIPIGPGHDTFADRAKRSVREQTIPVVGIAHADTDGHGAGWARNRLLEKVETPYVAFLDSDDWIESDFASVMLSAAKESGGKYVYSGWFEEYPDKSIPVQPQSRCYCFDNGWQVHLVTAIVRTEWLRAIGGFDESLPGMEDTDLYHRLHESGHCGQAVDKALIHYTYAGQRSRSFQQRPDYYEVKEKIGRRYHKQNMSCCGGTPIINSAPQGEYQQGDVLAQMLGAALVTVGRQSRRIYPRAGYGALVWADPRDVAADPMRFRSVEQIGGGLQSGAPEPISPEPVVNTADDLARVIEAQRSKAFIPPSTSTQQGRPSIGDLRRKAGF